MNLAVTIPAVLCILALLGYAWLHVTTTPPPKTRRRERDPYQMKPMQPVTGTDIEPVKPREVEPAPVFKVPEPVPPDVTLDRYRRRIALLEAELTDARNIADQLMKQLQLKGPVDMIVIYLDAHGLPASTSEIARALDLPPSEARRRLVALNDAVVELDPDKWKLVDA